ncbi:uncharacterized protein LOC134837570 [Culicoides brevitarsis]|uniref:uncharacterized protein LOC134837570 n=1 Tax=Culicoides brevitarsis TaxID=469753 RepID=UPI00307C3BB8
MQKILFLTLCLVAFSIQRIQATEEVSFEGPAVLEHEDQLFDDDFEREKRGDYKLVKIELEKVHDPKSSDKKSCSEMKNQLNFEFKKEFDLEKLSKSSSEELLKKLQNLMDHLYHLKTDCEVKEEAEHKPVPCVGCKKGASYEGNKYKSYHERDEPKNFKAVSHRRHFEEDDRNYDKHYYAHNRHEKSPKHPHHDHHEDKYSHKKPHYETTTEKSYRKTTPEPKKTTTEKPKYHPQDPFYERDHQKSHSYKEKKDFPQKNYPQVETNTEETHKSHDYYDKHWSKEEKSSHKKHDYDQKSPKHHEKYHYEHEDKKYEPKKVDHEKKSSYKPNFYEKHDHEKLNYREEKFPVHDKPCEKYYVAEVPYYLHSNHHREEPLSHKKPHKEHFYPKGDDFEHKSSYHFDEPSYKKPKTTKKPHKEHHYYPKGDDYEPKPVYKYPEYDEEPSYKKPKTTKKPQKEHFYPKGDDFEPKKVHRYPEHDDEPSYKKPKTTKKPHKTVGHHFYEDKHYFSKNEDHFSKKSLVKSNYEHENPYYFHEEEPYHKHETKKPHKYHHFEEEKEKFSHQHHEKSHVKSKYEPFYYEEDHHGKKKFTTKKPFKSHFDEEKHYPSKYDEFKQKTTSKPHKKDFYHADVHYERPVSYEKPHYYHPKHEKTTTYRPFYEKEHGEGPKYVFDVKHGDEEFFRDHKKHSKPRPKATPEPEEPSTEPAPTPKSHKYYEPHFEPFDDYVKYYQKDSHKYFNDVTRYLHKKERPSCEKNHHQLPLAFHPNRYESLKRPESPVHHSATLLKHLSGPDFYHFLPMTECTLHESHQKPRKYAFTKSELYITKRKADGEDSKVDKEDDVKEENVPVWEDSAAVEGGNGEILSLMGDLGNGEDQTEKKSENPPSYDTLVSKIKSEMEKIEQELMKRQGKNPNLDEDENDVNVNYNPDAETVFATDDDIQQRYERSLSEQKEREALKNKEFEDKEAETQQRSVRSLLKKEKPKKDFLSDLFKRKKEQDKAKTMKSLFPSEKPSKKAQKGLFKKY